MNIPVSAATGEFSSNLLSVTPFNECMVEGIVRRLDLVGRDLAISIPEGQESFDVPPDCPVILNGERVKMRMVQPGDRVWVTFRRTPDRLVTQQLDVQPKALLCRVQRGERRSA